MAGRPWGSNSFLYGAGERKGKGEPMRARQGGWPQCNGFQNVVPRTMASRSPGNLLQIQVLDPHFTPTESEIGIETWTSVLELALLVIRRYLRFENNSDFSFPASVWGTEWPGWEGSNPRVPGLTSQKVEVGLKYAGSRIKQRCTC